MSSEKTAWELGSEESRRSVDLKVVFEGRSFSAELVE
jgi:hypothetical protein